MKKAFTMIELILVIVIIGIISSIAVPRLLATRDDAKVASMANQVAQSGREVVAYALSQGIPSKDIPAMSKVAKQLVDNGDAVFDSDNDVLKIKMNTVDDCLKLTIESSDNDMNLTLTDGDAGSDKVCKSLQNKFDLVEYSLPLKGTRVKY